MSDDLAAFFAKKTKGGKKKKGVIELKEISEQLERKAMEQKDEGEDAENKPVDEGNNASRNRQPDNNAEDSEWLEFDDTPNISVAIREMVDDEHEADSDGKRASVEPIRTWNLHIDESEEPADDKSPATVKKETKYVVRGAQREKAPPLDLGNEEMFPSIEKAPEVEQKLKVLDEERRRAEVEERKRKEEEQKRLEEEQARRGKMYKAPRGADAGAAGGEGNSRTPVAADEVSSWRSKAEPTPSPAPTQPAADDEPRKSKYVPPHMRKQ